MIQSKASSRQTTFVTVRFGNVLGSNGSVIPLFVEQLKHGGPVTVTHPDVRRYFMLIPEAVQLVLHAAAAGESNSIYVLDMGEPVRLLDVARDLIRLSGFRPDEVPITFIGLRPGEKLDEELVGSDEVVSTSPVQSVMQVKPRRTPEAVWLRSQIRLLEKSALLGETDAVMARLNAIVPEFASPATLPQLPAAPETTVPVAATATQTQLQPVPAATVPVCGACASASVRRSRVSGALEHIRLQLAEKRPYRCYSCGWRGWLDVGPVIPPPATAVVSRPDLRALDAAFRSAIQPPLSTPAPVVLSRLDPVWLASSDESLAGDAAH